MSLNAQQLQQYEEDGYVVIPDVVPPQELKALLERLDEYAYERRPAGEVRIQIEPRVVRGEMQVAHKGDAVRKMEGLVENDDLFRALGLRPNIVGMVTSVLGPDLKMFRNAVLMKLAGVGSAKGMHQDSPYWPIEPMALASMWIALDPATLENGCMTAVPGSHRGAPLPHVHVTDDYIVEEAEYDVSKVVPIPMPAGAGLLFHSLLLHGTAPNISSKPRRAITLSYMSSQSRYTGKSPKPEYFHVAGREYPDGV
jgi:ectoine hydroxylase-related dioxygenase (phytanoyl-CoA dioxygenase family)